MRLLYQLGACVKWDLGMKPNSHTASDQTEMGEGLGTAGGLPSCQDQVNLLRLQLVLRHKAQYKSKGKA